MSTLETGVYYTGRQGHLVRDNVMTGREATNKGRTRLARSHLLEALNTPLHGPPAPLHQRYPKTRAERAGSYSYKIPGTREI